MRASGVTGLVVAMMIASPAYAGPGDHDCQARTLRAVPAVESPTSVLRAGQTIDVTQYRRNTRTGATSFCGHGDYCYPARVRVGRRQVEAIRLVNCTISSHGENMGEGEMIYSLDVARHRRGRR